MDGHKEPGEFKQQLRYSVNGEKWEYSENGFANKRFDSFYVFCFSCFPRFDVCDTLNARYDL